jgi:hypothetical protein
MTDSPAMELIRHFEKHQGHGMGRSRERTADGIRSAVRLAIGYGLKFAEDDFSELARHRSQSYYSTCIYAAGEEDYAMACGSKRGRFNGSAVKSFEKWKSRKPFLLRDPGTQSPTRVYVGREIEWYGERAKCTSFAEDGSHFVACTYKRDSADPEVGGAVHYVEGGFRRVVSTSEDQVTLGPVLPNDNKPWQEKVAKRMKITHQDIRDYHAAMKRSEDVKRIFGRLEIAQQMALATWVQSRFGEERRDWNSFGLCELDEIEKQIEKVGND